MCHHCGAVVADSGGQKLENGSSVKLDDAGAMCFCKVCNENQEQETMKRDNGSSSESLMLSPMPSQSSCISDCSTMGSLDIRDGQEGSTGSSQEDIDYKQERRSQNLSGVVHSNVQLSGRDDESVMPINNQEATHNSFGVPVNAEFEKSNSSWMDTNLWDPPEPEDPEDHMEGGMGYYGDDDDDDDEFGDSTEWSMSSSFSRSVDEAGVSHRSKEEKQRAMQEVMNGKYKAFIRHLLNLVGVPSSGEDGENWADIVCSLSWEAATFLKPLVNGKAMDPGAQVKVKCIASGTRSQSQFVKGMVFKKHAAHKHMVTNWKNPRLILIQGRLGEAPISGLSSFNSMDQENDFTNYVIEMIETCTANVIIVEKTASRVIQEAILKRCITLVLDMKLHRLERIALCTGSPILTSETLVSQKARQCDAVYFQKVVEHSGGLEGGKRSTKTLMFIEGCPARLGCTILLKGACSELKRVKLVVQRAVVMAFHLILETSFLVDQRAMFATIPFGGVSTMVSPDPQSPLEPCSSNILQVENANDKSEIPTDSMDIFISRRPREESSKGSNLEPVEKPIIPSELEPYNPAILSGFSSISDSFKKVMGESFLLSSTHHSLSSYFGHERDRIGLVPKSDSIPSTPQATNRFDVQVRGSSDEENSGHKQSSSHQSTLEGLGFHENAPNCSEETMQKNSSLDSQSILVLISSRNALKGTMCEQSHFWHIVFYRNFDVPLGKFLQENLLNQKNFCTVCGELPEAHFYYYAYYGKQLSIQVRQLPEYVVLPGETEGKLWMWSRCSKCKSKGEPCTSTKRVLISTAARSLSFGKFLELCFSDETLPSKSSGCGHSLFGDFLYFFGLGNRVAMFRYSTAVIYMVSMPPQKLDFNSSMRQGHLIRETKNVYNKGMFLFTEIAHSLKKISSEKKSSNVKPQGFLNDLSFIEEMLKQEKSEFEVKIQNSLAFHKYLSLNQLLWELLLESCIWDRRLQSLTSLGLTSTPGTFENVEPEPVMLNMNSNIDAGYEESESIAANDDTEVQQDVSWDENVLPVKEIAVEGSDGESGCDENHSPSVTEVTEIRIMDDLRPKQLSRQGSLSNGFNHHHLDDEDSQVRVASSGDMHVDRTIPISTADSSLGKLLWAPCVEIRQMHIRDILRSFFPELKSFSSYTPKLIPAASAFTNEEGQKLHIRLAKDNFIVSDYEGELSSIVACVLALLEDLSLQTDSHNEDSKGEGGGVSQPTLSSQSLNKVPSNGSSDSDLSAASDAYQFSNFERLNLLDSLVPETFKRTDHEGVIKSLANGKYVVNCPYFNQFRDLRSQCCPSELHYIASLSRCIKWNAKGGKSNSFFAKTLDDRFIIKEIKRTEYDSFMKFAPEYFEYIKKSFDMGNQTCLAKVLGIYQVAVREPKSGKEMRHDVMVMENLSFGRNIIRQYDLKGALHARYNPAANNFGEVLLDQNFVKDMNSSPIYVSNRAKRRMQRAIWNDTAFLNSINVMDYSLLVGVDAEKKEFVCGIIDYLRQYTWDKQLETWVKSSLVPKNVLPTVISPKEYKRRFRKFMSAHFLSVPDHWCLQQNFP
ncbi:putative 1-phosphatidylinositol-3-phosphate 5-kinase FAB1D isoform X1 [Cucurbita maxima]|uniref:1-phosphatidylinositol-3-phosphate 5-kinase n=2 Tax=Cucurbita maxima TaxID=3661 RepID=A0A6J1I9V1_CUCMA|nr:putative 1-phosphatidylinositol-3-phosphate 5-kinase FAB1D isoform X1 [Cucurbita maxima]XP_022972868.1 putative 1-phosphatidylinositol-3-phosphate 5-kinase FAB1D isoform X1 [Cucurbita maxima]XP_022972869.1 putative 1-phosphatidylinositol-3-phosphate 5-kinase FAB1D isoform X1 [Cucurbita maxima]XP_022972870.1 putative 1-phosphatidylinositol-3-phosphate 5-kinase FAB1D isoform X1 [Cucurbita maxima]